MTGQKSPDKCAGLTARDIVKALRRSPAQKIPGDLNLYAAAHDIHCDHSRRGQTDYDGEFEVEASGVLKIYTRSQGPTGSI